MSETFAGLLERWPAPWTSGIETGCPFVNKAHVLDANGHTVLHHIPEPLARAIAALPALVGALERIATTDVHEVNDLTDGDGVDALHCGMCGVVFSADGSEGHDPDYPCGIALAALTAATGAGEVAS